MRSWKAVGDRGWEATLQSTGWSVGAYLDDWLERRRSQLRPTTHHSYRQLIRCYLWPALGAQPLTAVDRRMLELAYAKLLAQGGRGGRPLAPKTVQYCHRVLRRALEDALLDGLIDANPARTARPPRHDPGDDEFDDDLQVWTGEHAAAFLAFVDEEPLRALWHLALGSGARRGELLGLRWVNVDLEAAEVRIRRSLSVIDGVPRLLGTKTSRARTLSVGASVVEALREHRDLEDRRRAEAASWDNRWGLVFTGAGGGPIDPFLATTAFRALVRAAPVPVIPLHDLRHCNASLLPGVRRGADQGGQRTPGTHHDRHDHGRLQPRPARDGRRRRHAPGRPPPRLIPRLVAAATPAWDRPARGVVSAIRSGPRRDQRAHRSYRGSTKRKGGVMAVKKIPVALDPDVVEAAAVMAEEQGQSLSAWLNDAARRRLVIERGRRAVVEWQNERGELTADERASAAALMDDLLGAVRRRSS